MLKPVPMAKVAIVGPKSRLKETIDTLHRLNLLHIEDFSEQDEFFALGSPLAHGSKISERLLRVRGVMKGAGLEAPKAMRPFTMENLRALEEKLSEVEEELAHLVEERGTLHDDAKRVEEEDAVFARIQRFPFPTRLLIGYRSLVTATGFVPEEADLTALRSVAPGVDVAESLEDDGRFVAVLAPKEAERRIQEALGKLEFEPLDVPPADAAPAAHRTALAERRRNLQEQIAILDAKIGAIQERHAAAFFALDEYLSIEADKATTPVRFRTTPHSFMAEGWIPADSFARLEQALIAGTRSTVYLTRLERAATGGAAKPHGPHDAKESHEEPESIPVMLRNPKPSGPYELLTDTYSRPKYRELDPTLFMYVGFPFFYGLMLGDIGYGLVLLFMVWFGVFNKLYTIFGFQSRWHLNRIFVHASLSSTLFGVLYGEFFGLEIIGPAVDAHGETTAAWLHYSAHWGAFTYPLSRFHNVKLLLALALLIGALHMFIGLILGMRNAKVAHGLGAAIKHRGSWLAILTAVSLVGIALVPGILGLGSVSNPVPFYVLGLAAFVVGVVLLVMGEGATALPELPTVLSNLLSYTRLVAIGLSGAGIALAGNEIAALFFDAGGFMIAAGVLSLAIFHLINVALGIIGPALHSLRLHYVEFFTKFYEGGGIPYAPFGATRKFTVKEVKQA